MKYPSKDQGKRGLFTSLVEGLLRTNGTGHGLTVDQSAGDTQTALSGLVYGPCEICHSAPTIAFTTDQSGAEVGICASPSCYRAAKSR